ncbi:polysaccharide deacetylase family protein [Pseudanabaena sp. FACHB-2040]|uniref:polysaccharide deacetylase family protein n=1 Tax=Pseudanabaena sp. FACHB-2040 TaxID=2692859 RepID=UPI001689427E|nr:polysaccharide deacetylase family protein [Pseudanabaena sp. FACHB-2040]MBD2260298.1 polysaccharide deacetylase family protein [Pseudanabaena sp. FACHB-2040]
MPKKWGKFLVGIGIGGLLLGAATPFAEIFQGGVGKPQGLNSALMEFTASPGVEAFPSSVSNERACRTQSLLEGQQPPTSSSLPTAVPVMGLGSLQALVRLGANQIEGLQWPQIDEQARLARVPIVMYHDVLAEKEVSFDVTPEQLENHLKAIQAQGLTPVSLDQVVQHLRTGLPLPEKPILLTFDDGYVGHFEQAYPLLKQYQMPAVFSVFPGKLNGEIVGRSTVTWEQLKEMAADPLITIASHSVTHPPNLTQLSDEDLWREVADSKAQLEAQLGMPIKYFTYPAGHYDERVTAAVSQAGYLAALTMREENEQFAGASESLLTIERFGQSNLEQLLDQAWGGASRPQRLAAGTFDFSAPIEASEIVQEDNTLVLITGGHPVTVHADSRYQVPEIVAKTNAIAAVDGGFFSLKYLDSNVMIGPVLSQSSRRFVPGNGSENPLLNGRPLVLITPDAVKFIPFDAARHNTLSGLHQAAKGVTDAFVGAAWLVKDGEPQPANSFGTLFDYDANRHRAFWGINTAGQPVVGVSQSRVDSVTLGRLLAEAGLQDAIMLDSGASTSLAFRGESLVGYEPRPVPHVVALIPPEKVDGLCPLRMEDGVQEAAEAVGTAP